MRGKRLKVLLSAFSCRPGRGSEPEVGWQWAWQMARFHDVTVFTQAKHRGAIEAELARRLAGSETPRFEYFDGGSLALKLHRSFGAKRLYYMWWQRAAWPVVARLHRDRGFDLMHHVTFAGFRYATAIWDHGVPVIWGPIGGMEAIPWPLMPWRHPGSLCFELARNFSNFIRTSPFGALPERAGKSALVLASTRETERALANLGIRSELMPTVGITADLITSHPIVAPVGPLQLLFAGHMLALKGIDLAIEALAQSAADAHLTLIGSGPFENAVRNLAQRLGMTARITFSGRLPREEMLKRYRDFHVFIFPSLHDSGGLATLEAMCNGLPNIVVDCGGPMVSVGDGRGLKVMPTTRAGVIDGLAKAIRTYDQNRALVAGHGLAAREYVREHYEWSRKGAEMNAVYERVLAAGDTAVTRPPSPAQP